MLHSFFSSILSNASNDARQTTRRKHARRESDRCICLIHGASFPVENWSFGGLLISADERMFRAGQSLNMTLKFKLRHSIIDIAVAGSVLRRSPGKIGIQFEPVTQTIRRNFQQVIDDQVAWEFADSQV
jgi:hypothetical protein